MSRNEPCPCGSGKRIKHCHGALAPSTAVPGAPVSQAIGSGTVTSAVPSPLHLEALAAHRTGALRRAEKLYRRALERDPGDVESLHMLGVAQFELMRYPEALALLWEACERSGWNDDVFRHNLGLVLAKLLGPSANDRQEELVRAYIARERERAATPPVEARVSVVLTTRNDAPFIERALDSVAAQTYRDLELIVADFGSSDATPALVARRLPTLGIAARVTAAAPASEALAANAAADHAQGRYLAFLSGHEWFAPQRIERLVAAIARPVPSWGFSRVASAHGSSHGAEAASRPGESLGWEPGSFTIMISNALESNGNLFIDREIFRTLGGFRDVPDPGADLRERAARDVEPVVVPEHLYLSDARSDAAAVRERRAAAEDRLSRALTENATAANPFSPLHPANRDVLLRAELRAGRGDRIPVPVLRSLGAHWLQRTPVVTPRARTDRGRSPAAKTAIVVLGAYRSGTSALARVLNLCGAFLPQRIVAARLAINPKGFWETEAVNDLNARLMRYLGADWNRVHFKLPASGPLLDEFLLNTRDVLESEYADAPLILIKDPRVCVLAPWWHRALKEHRYRPAYVVCMRNPLEVARSLGSDMSTSQGLALWSEYMQRVNAFTALRDVSAVHVQYSDLLGDWRGVVGRIARRLDVSLAADARADEVDAFLEAALRNHRATDADLEQLPGPEGNAVRALYERMIARCARDAAA
jgi:tetratricopeptide (TPR) repeat protein